MRDAAADSNPSSLGALALFGDPPVTERQACASTVRHVFELIWPQACIACHAGGTVCRVDVWQDGLHHAVNVPWGLVEFDHGLILVRAVYRAGLPGTLQRAEAGLSLAL